MLPWPEVGLSQRLELPGTFHTATGVAVAWEIHEIERWRRAPPDAKQVREPRLAWCRAGAGDALPQQRVNQARLADVRAPDHGQFRQSIGRKIRGARSAFDEVGGDFHW